MIYQLLRPRGIAVAAKGDFVVTFAVLSLGGIVFFCLARPATVLRLSQVPASALLAVALSLSVAIACAGQSYVHRRFKGQDFVQHNEVGGFIVAVAGSLYAVVLGFLTVVAWQHYTDARQLVAAEAAAAVDAWHVAYGLPPTPRTQIRQDVLEYSQRMISDEWPQMSAGGSDLRSGIVIMDAITRTESSKPAEFGQSNAQSATLQQLGVMHDTRQRRLADNGSGISPFEWLVLLIGASCVICFCWLFGLANMRVHLLMTSIVTIIITSTLVLLFELQYPFHAGHGILPTDWSAAIDHIHSMQTGQMSMRM